jgi:DNA-binding transcriptional regulator YhcF (GntR family)
MEFQIEKNSSVPVIKQIQEQIKLSIAMGALKRGDILPSIREIEKRTGINRGQIHRAFLALHRSGLLAPAPGKRIAVAISAAASDSVNEQCRDLTRDIIRRVRKIGVSPIAFARYLSQNVQDDERCTPFIAYVDSDKEIAHRRAEQVSRMWHASVSGMTVDEYKQALLRGSKLRKVLVNHLTFDAVRRLRRGSKIDVIPIEICYTDKTIRALGKIKGSSLLSLLPNPAISSARFIVEQMHKWMKGKDRKLSWMNVDDVTDFTKLLHSTKYDHILVSPGAWNKVPVELRRNPRLLQLQMEFDPEALEIARIRAGVIV